MIADISYDRFPIPFARDRRAALCVLVPFFVFLTALMAKTSFPLPWTPVPVTGQTYAVLLSAVVLGRWGAVSQVLYAAAACLGLPVLAGRTVGPAFITGPTAGYVLGFIIAAYFAGKCIESGAGRPGPARLILTLAWANMIILVMGAVWLYVWLDLAGTPVGISSLMMKGVVPFIPGAIVKTFLAAGTGILLFSESNSPLKMN